LTKGDARKSGSRSVARVKSIKFSAQRRPSEGTARSLRAVGPSCLGGSNDPWLDEDQLTAGLCSHLDRASGLKDVHVEKRVGDGLRDREQTMVAQHEEVLVTQIMIAS
jgi:hypothetical protein